MHSIRIIIHLSCLLSGMLHAADTRPLNIILIMADDLGYETIGTNGGSSYQTPHLDRMARQGTRFTHAYSQPICTPSRVQIMTGKYNFRNYVAFGTLKRGERTFAHLFQEAGYATCIAGKWQLGKETDSPQHFGFDRSLLWQHTRSGRSEKHGKAVHDKRYENPLLERNGVEEEYHNGEFGPDLVTDFLCEFITQEKDRPFLAYYPMMLTHCPWVPTPGSGDWDPKSPGSATYKGNPQQFGLMANYMDHLVGRITKHVESLGLAERTIILFTGDNGTDQPIVSQWNGQSYAGGKGSTTDAGTHVPFIVWGAGVAKERVVNDLVNFTDILPTLCDLAGIKPPEDPSLDGHSIAPQIRGDKGTPRTSSYCWYDRDGKRKKPKIFARTQRYKLYHDDRFYDLQQDAREQSPVPPDQLDPAQTEIKAMLRAVIRKYDDQGA